MVKYTARVAHAVHGQILYQKECCCSVMPVYSLAAWAIDESSPLDPALSHGDDFLPGVPHLLHFRLHVSLPDVSWLSSFPLGVPCQGLSRDARLSFSQRVTN